MQAILIQQKLDGALNDEDEDSKAKKEKGKGFFFKSEQETKNLSTTKLTTLSS